MLQEKHMSKKEHSIKVPRLYKVAATVLNQYRQGQGSLKNLLYSDSVRKKHPNVNALFALTLNCTKKLSRLESAFKELNLKAKEPRLDENLACILITELFWGKGKLPGDSKPVQTLLQYEHQLRRILKHELSTVMRCTNPVDRKPRYARVNAMKISTDEVIDQLISEGYQLVDFSQGDYDDFLSKVPCLAENQFMLDFHVPNLLVFAKGTKFFDYSLYQDGSIILQDKASCLPVCALAPPAGSVVLDACAAPGMKTSQVVATTWKSSLSSLKNVYAVEKDVQRCDTMRKLLRKFDCADNVTVIQADFMSLEPAAFADVEYILLDPTCSGSGLESDSDCTDATRESRARLEKLRSFQGKMLHHAIKFPNVKRIAYSTCSSFEEENEQVIRDVLQSESNQGEFHLVNILPDWPRRGFFRRGDQSTKCMIRTDPGKDLCIGFFVAVIERTA